MNRRKIFLTGATGFLGSHIARRLIENGYSLILSCRTQSDFSRCEDFKDKAIWVDLSLETWMSDVEAFKPQVILNAAWQGVGANCREEWHVQIENLIFQQDLLDLSRKIGVETFIGFGSQAEYGDDIYYPKETDVSDATTAYGAVKSAALQIVKTFCGKYQINWIWLRLFSFFGEGEADNWLIPSVIKKIKANELLELTPGEQQFAYIYVDDLAEIVVEMIEINISSGIYNVSGNMLISIKELVTKIRDLVNPAYELKFGTIPYRKNQPMKIIGNTDKLNNALSSIIYSDFDLNITNVVKYYLGKN